MDDKPQRPLPNLQEMDTAPFWTATQSREFRFQQCASCGTIVWYPRAHCTGCLEGALEWRTSSGRGTIYTYSIIRQSYHPFFRQQVPYAVAYVDLEEGVRFLTAVTGVDDPADLEIGQAVEIEWEQHDEVAIPLVRPV